MTLFYIFGSLTLISLGLNVWQWLAARRFPLHQPIPELREAASAERGIDFRGPGGLVSRAPLPSVTLLKPLNGCDEHAESCLRSWLTQDYPAPVQVLFGVKDAADPVCKVVRKLIGEFPQLDARLVICPESLGPNPKVSTLMQLEPLIGVANGGATFVSPGPFDKNVAAPAHAIVISDADVKVPPGYLKEAMTVLQRDGVGLVNSFYRLANPQNRAMWIEAIAVNCDFWSQVCQSNSMRPMEFALGAAMTLRIETLRQIGGFKSLVDYIADDNRLGLLVHRAGQRVELTNAVVDCYSGPMTFRQVWDHQLRWARTIRMCEPVPFFFSVLANPLVWSVGWLLASGPLRSVGLSLGALAGLTVYASLRLFTAHANFRKLTNAKPPRWKLLKLMDQKDALTFVWWLCAFLGNTIVWRGRRHRLLKEGRLEPVD